MTPTEYQQIRASAYHDFQVILETLDRAKRLTKQLNESFGLLYGDDDTDLLGQIEQAMLQARYDRLGFVEFIDCMFLDDAEAAV
jgi:hypothetical protein